MKLVRNTMSRLILCLALVSMTSCGFTLRTADFPQLDAVFLSQDLPLDVRLALVSRVNSIPTKLRENPDSNTAAVKSIEEAIHERSVSSDTFGRAIEIRIQVDWKVSISDGSNVSEMVIVESETIAVDEGSLIGAENEKHHVIDLLRDKLATELLMRLSLRAK